MEETKVIWKDTTSYNKYAKDEKQSAWSYQNGDLRITVICSQKDYPGSWIMHCYSAGFNTFDMQRTVKTTTPEQAQELALKYVKNRLQKLLNSMPIEKPKEPSSEETLMGHFKSDAE